MLHSARAHRERLRLPALSFPTDHPDHGFASSVRPPDFAAAQSPAADPLGDSADAQWSLDMPQARRGLVTGITLGIAHTVGEFGVVLMNGGNIPRETRVLSIASYDHVEALQYQHAHVLSAGLLGFSFLVLLLVVAINRRWSITR